MSSPAWLQLLDAMLKKESNAVTARFVQLATLTDHGRPSVRTAVFRGWYFDPQRNSHSLQITTDLRSTKMPGIFKHPFAEETRVQFRLMGDISVIDATAHGAPLQSLRHRSWAELSPSARRAFAGAPPGSSRPNATSNSPAPPPPPPQVHPEEPLDSFALLLLHVQKVDVVDLRSTERTVFERAPDGQWTQADVFC